LNQSNQFKSSKKNKGTSFLRARYASGIRNAPTEAGGEISWSQITTINKRIYYRALLELRNWKIKTNYLPLTSVTSRVSIIK
jgi:hypothetical protein